MSGFPSSYSPKSSPRGARSPVVSRQDSTGTLKTTISLGKNPSIVHSGPFYLMKEPPCECLRADRGRSSSPVVSRSDAVLATVFFNPPSVRRERPPLKTIRSRAHDTFVCRRTHDPFFRDICLLRHTVIRP